MSEPLTVLCFGDSNTYGLRSELGAAGRWPRSVRWTGRLQLLLGPTWYVIEEGLCGRTTDVDDPEHEGLNGRAYFRPCLQSHEPLDAVVIMLGTNDLKGRFQRTPQDIAKALRGLISDAKHLGRRGGNEPQIILVSPLYLRHAQKYDEEYYQECVPKSQLLTEPLAALAKDEGCIFVDAARLAEPGVDGVHFSEASHEQFSQQMAKVIRALPKPDYR